MNQKIAFIVSDGVGGQLLAFQCAKYLIERGLDVTMVSSARDEVFKPINYLFGKTHKLIQIPESAADVLSSCPDKESLKNTVLQYTNQLFDEIYLVWPDLLFKHKFSFDYQKYGLNIQEIVKTKLLQKERKSEKVIFCALNTSTDQYRYKDVSGLVRQIAKVLPDYEVYFNNLNKWASKDLYNGDFRSLPSNVRYFENQDFNESLEWLKKSCYCVCLDNGISHLAHSFGVCRLLLDSRSGPAPMNLLFRSRWREEDLYESIDLNSNVEQIAFTIKTNLQIPQTLLVPRKIVYDNLIVNWPQVLGFKY